MIIWPRVYLQFFFFFRSAFRIHLDPNDISRSAFFFTEFRIFRPDTIQTPSVFYMFSCSTILVVRPFELLFEDILALPRS